MPRTNVKRNRDLDSDAKTFASHTEAANDDLHQAVVLSEVDVATGDVLGPWNPVDVTGPLTDAELRASDVSVAQKAQAVSGPNGFLLNDTSERTVTVTTTSGSYVVTSAAAFTAADLGAGIEGTGIPDNAIIVAVTDTSTVTFGTPQDSDNPYGEAATASGSISATIREGFAGTFVTTRADGVVRELSVLGTFTLDGTPFPSDLGGTFVFQYSENGSTATINEVRAIGDFAAVRDFDLVNAGSHYRIMFAPSRVVTASEFIFGATTLRHHFDGQFVRLANQEIEEGNAAMGQTFAYLKSFSPFTGKSVNIRAPGRDPGNSTTDVLNGNSGGSDHIYRGTWFEWQGTYVALQTEVSSDVPGTLFIDFATAATPTDGDESSVAFSIEVQYDPAVGVGVVRRTTPVQSRWVRHRYVNGLSAQSAFQLDGAFLTNSPPPVVASILQAPRPEALAGIDRVKLFAADAAGDHDFITRTDSKLDVNVAGFTAEAFIKPLNDLNVGQRTISSLSASAVPNAGAGLANRKTIEFSNHSSAVNVYFGPTSAVTATTGKILRSGSDVAIECDETVDFYWIAQDTGGTTNTTDESGSATAGTATSTGNALASDDARTSFTNGQTLEVSGFGFTQTLATVNTVRIGIEGRKASTPATQTVAHQETQTGTTTGAPSVSSASLAGGDDQLYVVFVSRNALNNVASISGGGNAFTSLIVNQETAGKHLDVWYAQGSFTAGAVTALMSSSTSAHIVVVRVTGHDPTTPFEDFDVNTGSGTAVVGPSLLKTALGLGITGVSHERPTFTQGAGYALRANLTTGTGSNTNSLGVQTKPFVATGTEAATATLSGGGGGASDWLAASVRIQPAATQTVTFDVEFDDGSGYQSAGSVDESTTSDTTQYLDISGLHQLTEATINATTVRLTRNSVGVAAGEVDHVFLEVEEGTADSAARISFAEIADTDL